jgi:hypothetical protein
MKMYMPLLATESGHVTFSKPAGSTLASGDVIGKLALDDPSRVKSAALYEGELPALGYVCIMLIFFIFTLFGFSVLIFQPSPILWRQAAPDSS